MMNRKWLFGFMLAISVMVIMSVASWAQVKGEVTADSVNIRTEASLNSEVLYMVDRGQPVNIMAVEGDFYNISLNTESDLYIAKQYVAVTEIIGMVTRGNTPLLDKPLSEGGIPVTTVERSFAVNIQSQDEGGYYIDYNGMDFYIEKQSLTVPNIVEIPVQTKIIVEHNGTVSGADDIVSYAKQFLGVPYRYGGNSPNSGFDCSGFVTYVLKNFGVSVSRSSASMANNGVEVSKDNLLTGDLLFFATTNGSSRISHAGMYIGGGQFIHATTWGGSVSITDLNDPYYTRCYVKARRVL